MAALAMSRYVGLPASIRSLRRRPAKSATAPPEASTGFSGLPISIP